MTIIKFALILIITTAGIAQGSLIMEIDTATKSLNMTGSVTGNFDYDDVGSYTAMWGLGDFSPSLMEGDLKLSATFAQTFTDTCEIGLYNTHGVVDIYLRNSGIDITTLSGNGTDISYAHLQLDHQKNIESAIGQSMPLLIGSGFGSISVIPEPSSSMLMLVIGCGGWFLRKRQKR